MGDVFVHFVDVEYHLFIYRCRFYFPTQNLLSDTEIPEDIAQHLIRRNLADYAADVVDGFADVLGGEIGREAGGEAVADAEEGSAGVREGLDVALVCYQGCVAFSEQIALG